MALSDAAIRAAKAGPAQFKLFDEGGLFLLVRPSGGKLWRLKYRHQGKEQQLSIGRYPDVGLKEARERRDQARKWVYLANQFFGIFSIAQPIQLNNMLPLKLFQRLHGRIEREAYSKQFLLPGDLLFLVFAGARDRGER